MSAAKELVKMFEHLTEKQQAFVISMAMKRGYDGPLTGGNFFKSMFKKVIKPLGSKLINDVALPIVRSTAQKALEKKLGLSGKAKKTKGGCARKTKGGALNLAGRALVQGKGVSVF